jgi:hypothetical protein
MLAMVRRGEGGEKETARGLLDAFMRKHSLTERELERALTARQGPRRRVPAPPPHPFFQMGGVRVVFIHVGHGFGGFGNTGDASTSTSTGFW